jgi:HD-GYP domain-containing protein (c-di-GMP phosphodiesterase class II)
MGMSGRPWDLFTKGNVVEVPVEKPLQLCYPVRAVDGTELLPAGAYLTQDTLAELVRSAQKRDFPTGRLMDYGTVAADLHRICERPPYSLIFTDAARMADIFKSMERIELVQPLLDIYGYFKANDPYTYRHILAVFVLSLLMAQDLMKDHQEVAREAAAAPNHDFGKLCVPLSILRKSTRLSERDQQQLSHHVAAGYVLLAYYLKDANHPAVITARDHHERCDGSGYPRGILLNNRMVEIVAVGDMFDALISKRPYRPRSFDQRTALEELTVQADRGAISKEVVRSLICINRKHPPCHPGCLFSYELRGTPPAGNQYRGVAPCHFDSACEEDE